MSARSASVRLGVFALAATLAFGSMSRAQEGQGRFVTQASARLVKLINSANAGGFNLADNSFSIGGGWLKQSQANWVPMFTVELQAGKQYRFLAAGDADAKDVDLEIQDANGRSVAVDDAVNPEAVITYTPANAGRYLVRIRLYDSRENYPCVCMAIVLQK